MGHYLEKVFGQHSIRRKGPSMVNHNPLIYFAVILPHTSRCTGNLASERFSVMKLRKCWSTWCTLFSCITKEFPCKDWGKKSQKP
jgi:hypothetical protein